jgi:hypothetical protein
MPRGKPYSKWGEAALRKEGKRRLMMWNNTILGFAGKDLPIDTKLRFQESARKHEHEWSLINFELRDRRYKRRRNKR